MVKQVATDMVMNVPFNVCEIAAENVEGSTIILQVDSFIHETLLISSNVALPAGSVQVQVQVQGLRQARSGHPSGIRNYPQGIELDWASAW
jgi:hypothetical protein